MGKSITNIEDRQQDYKLISEEVSIAELGIRSICVMYDEHSSDKKSKQNIFLLKDNIQYRLFSVVHQYFIFLKELGISESYLQSVHQMKPNLLNAFPLNNPYFDKVELELSSIFDSLIFQLSSVFDYLSHLICYITKTEKSNTFYWIKLAKAARGNDNELSKLTIKKTIDEIDRAFVTKLYDYRSRLLHNKRDRHEFTTTVELTDFHFNIKILASETALKHFKTIWTSIPEGDITLTYLSSWLIKQSFLDLEKILDALKDEISKDSHFHENLRNPKPGNSFMIISLNPKTNSASPVSDELWKQYKEKRAEVKNRI